MPEVLPIRREMFPELRDGVLRELNPNMSSELWERAFELGDPDEPRGYALAEGGSLVGLLGMIFSRRQIGGREERFCNLHSWYVQPEHRVRSLALIRPLAAMRDVTITDLSATSDVRAISQRLGFVELDQTAIVLPPLAWASDIERCEMIDLDDANDSAASILSPGERAIHRDHGRMACGQLLVCDSGGYCYIVYSRITHGVLPSIMATTLVHHLSDPPRFARYHATIRAHLMQHNSSQSVVVDSRLLAGANVPGTLRMPAIPKIFRSQRVRPEQIDGLYSEQVCFKLSTLPTLRSLLAAAGTLSSAKLVRGTALVTG